MRRLKIAGVGTLILAIVLAGGAWLMRGQIALGLMAKAYDRAMGSDPIAALPDGLSVGLCGSGSPMPDPTRAGPGRGIRGGLRAGPQLPHRASRPESHSAERLWRRSKVPSSGTRATSTTAGCGSAVVDVARVPEEGNARHIY